MALNTRNKVARPTKGTTVLTMVSAGGERRAVIYQGVYGVPPRLWIRWTLAGNYELSPRTGRLKGSPELRRWRLIAAELPAVRAAHRDALKQRAGLRELSQLTQEFCGYDRELAP